MLIPVSGHPVPVIPFTVPGFLVAPGETNAMPHQRAVHDFFSILSYVDPTHHQAEQQLRWHMRPFAGRLLWFETVEESYSSASCQTTFLTGNCKSFSIRDRNNEVVAAVLANQDQETGVFRLFYKVDNRVFDAHLTQYEGRFTAHQAQLHELIERVCFRHFWR